MHHSTLLKPTENQINQRVPSEKSSRTSKFNFGRCKVCKDKATGMHYGIPSCEGCKGFYKRSIDKHDKYVCYFGSKCSITPRQRRRCKLCRWKLCVEAGMSFDAIKMGRISKTEKEKVKRIIDVDTSTINSPIQSPAPSKTPEPKQSFQLQSSPLTVPINPSIIFNSTLNGIGSVNITRLMVKSEPEVINDPQRVALLKSIRDRCYIAYLDFSRDMIDVYRRAIECLKLNNPAPVQAECIDQTQIQHIWEQCLLKISENTKSIVFYIKSLPGFSQLDISDLSALFEEHTSTLMGLKITRTYVGDEVFFMITHNIRMTRGLMSRLMGAAIQERVFTFHEKFNHLGLNEAEMSLLMPAVMSYPKEEMVFKNPSQVRELHEYYKQALQLEFKANNRNDEFIQRLVETMKLVPMRRNFERSNN